jgi:LysM repeat protein
MGECGTGTVISKWEGVKKTLLALLSLVSVAPAAAQSLRGSHASVEKMYSRAVLNDLEFYRTSKSVYQSVRDGELVLIPITMDMTLDDVTYPFVLPRTKAVLDVFARKYHQACGERLVVTSAARPRTEQPRNASPQSVHPTGMAIDFRKPAGNCLSYMRSELVTLEKQGVIEATEERHPVHFHVAVLRRGEFAPATTIAAAAEATATSSPATPTEPAAAAPAATADSAGGTVELPPKPAKAKTYTVRKGDNLSVIAKRFGLTVTRLKALNGLKGSALKPGQKLRIG